jgi:hypothetical protein
LLKLTGDYHKVDPLFVNYSDNVLRAVDYRNLTVSLENAHPARESKKIRCYRCDNKHYLDFYYAKVETV